MQKILNTLRAYKPSDVHLPFAVTFKMSTPIMLGHPYIHGDSLLATMLMRDVLGDEYYNLSAKSPISLDKFLELPVRKTHDVYHASVSQFNIDRMFSDTIYKRFDEKDLETNYTGKLKKVRKGQGQFRDYMMTIPVIPASEVTFHYNGNPDECFRLLSDIHHLGKKTDIGYGKVRSASLYMEEHDNSFFMDGKCMRPLPKEIYKHLGLPNRVMSLAYKPPYWDKKNVAMCMAPGSEFVAF